MKKEIKKLPKSKVKILFSLGWEEFEPYMRKASVEISEKINIKGFRPGKAPQEIVEKEIGQKDIMEKAAAIAIKEEYPKIIAEEKIEVIGSPKIEILKLAPGNPFSFKIEADILPKIPLPDYKKIVSQIKGKEIKVGDKEVEDALAWLRDSRKEFKELDRESRKGDFLGIEYEMEVMGPFGEKDYSLPQMEKGKLYRDEFFLGKGKFVSGFEKKLEGMKQEETKEFSLVFPKKEELDGTRLSEYGKLAGKKVNFKVKVKSIREVKLPELNDNFAKKVGNFNNMEELKKSIKEGIIQEKEIAEREEKRKRALEEISKEIDFEIPEILVANERENLFNSLRDKISSQLKISFEEYLDKVKKTEEEVKNSFSQKAEERVKNFLFLLEIGKKENIVVSEKEVEGAIDEFLKKYSEREGKEKIDPSYLREYYKNIIYNEKVFKAMGC